MSHEYLPWKAKKCCVYRGTGRGSYAEGVRTHASLQGACFTAVLSAAKPKATWHRLSWFDVWSGRGGVR